MTFADLQFVCLLSFTDAPEDDLAIWVGVISLHVKHLLLPQGFDLPVGPSSLGSGFHPTIRFTAEVSNEEHVFLDTKSRLVGNSIDVDLYTNPQTRINTFYPQAATRNTAAEMFRIVWLYVSGEYAQILIHLSLGQQSYRTNFEDEVTTYNQYPQRPRKPGHKEETTCFATSHNQNHQAH